ncbi:mismatched base pair and cruciform DNA recognition protein [Armillaria borealis]|uniref:Mismatched base pair and cruciform DNA recognition protein n=1 Tax=Armillaria borealis TaxID=47425 RepID=A0AA39J4M4_9AGAR|nr:mismatched base pair and cruciform DNA recognition protein [Armillaria borealis]
MSSDSNPSKSTGRYHSMKGNIVETVGKLTGSKEYNAARAQSYAEGSRDRASDYKEIIASLARDKSESTQAEGNVHQEKGQEQQELNRQA